MPAATNPAQVASLAGRRVRQARPGMASGRWKEREDLESNARNLLALTSHALEQKGTVILSYLLKLISLICSGPPHQMQRLSRGGITRTPSLLTSIVWLSDVCKAFKAEFQWVG
jgi:hypothetical protein